MKPINTKVIWIAPGYRAIIISNKKVSYKFTTGEKYPDRDYTIMLYKGNEIGFNGTAEVFESEIEEKNWIED